MSQDHEPPPSPQTLAAWAAATHDLLALTAPSGRLLWANGAFRAQFGNTLPEALAALEAQAGVPGLQHEMAIGGTWFAVHAQAGAEGIAWRLENQSQRREAARLRDLLDTARDFGRVGVWERDLVTGEGRWDPRIFEFWGLDPAGPTPSHDEAMHYLHPDDRVVLPREGLLSRPGRQSHRFRVVRPDGGMRWLHSQWEVRPGPDGRPAHAVGVMTDETEVYELARSLGDASAQLRLAVDLAQIAIWRHDLRTNRMYYNDRAFAVLDIPPRPEGMSLDEVRAFIHPDDLPEVVASAQRALAGEGPTDMAARYRRSDGSWRHVLTRRVVQRAPDGTPQAFLGVALDITEQFERQREARELALRLEIATGAAGIGIFSFEARTGAAEWNRQMFEINGVSVEDGVPDYRRWIEQVIHPDDRARMRGALNDLLSAPQGAVEHEYRIVRPDGAVRWLVNRARLVPRKERQLVVGVAIDVTDRRLAEQALRAADQRAALAARSAGIGTWEMDFAGGAERWDEQMFRLRGLEPRPHPPSRDDRLALVHPADRERTLDARASPTHEKRPMRYEFRVLLPDGSIRWLASRSIAVADERGRLQRRIGVNWDITDAKEAEAARQATAVAERASQAKSQFLARMSHELRTPLNAVLGFTQLLQFEDSDPARSVKLGHIRSAGEHLLSLIDGVLDLSSLESGSLRLEPQPLDLAALADQALPLVSVLAERHGVRLLRGEIGGVALADRTRTLQVLMNLLTNAIKYNRPGGEVRLSAQDDGDAVSLLVADTGRGMSPGQLEHLFEPFNRLGAEREGIEGTGIGMTIVKALVAGMGGRIEVSSEPGVGSRLRVTLPRTDVQASRASPPQPPASAPAPLQGPRGQLLYIEDNPVNVLLVEELVRGLSGLQVASEATGAAGVARAAAMRPDLVLIDMQLPDFDGFEVLRRLRAQPETAAIPCIALSANAMPEDVERARQAGFDDYWTKPIDFRAFLGALETRFPAD